MDVFFESLPFRDRLRYHFHRLMYRVHGRLKTLQQRGGPARYGRRGIRRPGPSDLFRRVLRHRHRRRHDPRQSPRCPVPPRRHAGRHVQHPAGGSLQGRAAAPALPAGDRADQVATPKSCTWMPAPTTGCACSSGPRSITRRWTPAPTPTSRAGSARSRPTKAPQGQPIEINGRDIPTRRRADGIAWFDFAALCDGPRSQDDYIEIARAFQTVIVSAVPGAGRNPRQSGPPLHRAGGRVLRPPGQADRLRGRAGPATSTAAPAWRGSSSAPQPAAGDAVHGLPGCTARALSAAQAALRERLKPFPQ